ncbi:MAG: HD domain-containing protein [Clostridia bacterium]|nr:HD domain-containing protein [Clostridia bacterium]
MIPENVLSILERLDNAGYPAYLVGGCVRDSIIGREVSDYDVTTSAPPDEVERVFSDLRVIETGIKHGTVTVISDGVPVEITTFRRDGEYLDSRHPESVTFSDNVEDDLSRRDFTVNSVAMSRKGAIVDPFGGRDDMARRLIRCTGEPERRFKEDALRIIRALRFASVLGFDIEEDTAASIHRNRALLEKVSVERVFTEFKKLLCGKNVFKILTEYSDVICTIIPEMEKCVGFDQKNRYHIYDAYTHIAKTVEAIEPDKVLRLTMFLHDIGKPYCFTEEESGVRHYRGHPAVSADIAKEWLRRMRADNETVRLVSLLCSLHDRPLNATKKAVKRLFKILSLDEIIMLCKVKKADSSAHSALGTAWGDTADEVIKIAQEIVDDKECLSRKDLAVKGDDLIALGYSGRQIGEALQTLLDLVIEEALPNERAALTEYLQSGKDGKLKINPKQFRVQSEDKLVRAAMIRKSQKDDVSITDTNR